MRYITPAHTIGNRFKNKNFPNWDILVVLFRDRGSPILREALGAQDYKSKVFSGIGRENTSHLEINGLNVGVVAHCIWGGPQASILVEESAEIGIKNIVGIGACGSIREDINRGSLVVAKSSLITDGTSRIYKFGNTAEPSFRLLNLAREVTHLNPIFAQAACIDAMYRETRELVNFLKKIGGEIINMESSAFYAASKLCNVESLWIGCVSDSINGDKWEDWSDIEDMSYQSGIFCKEILIKLSEIQT